MTKYSKRASSRNHHLDLFGRIASKSFAMAILPRGELQSDSATLSPSRLRILPRSDSRRQAIADRELADA